MTEIHNATGGNYDAPSTRPTPRRFGYRVGSPTPIDDFLEAVAKCVGDMLRVLDAWGYRWDADTETWSGPGLRAEKGEGEMLFPGAAPELLRASAAHAIRGDVAPARYVCSLCGAMLADSDAYVYKGAVYCGTHLDNEEEGGT